MTPAVTSIRPLVGAMTFEETWSIPCKPDADFLGVYPRWKANYYFGNQNDTTSRDYPGTLSVMLDTRFDPNARTLQSNGAVAMLQAYKLSTTDAAKYPNNTYAGAVLTTQNSFAQAYGYFEISAKLPDCSGTRPAFWLLPTAKTPDNGGRLAEIDIFEHYGGATTVMSGGVNPVVIDRVGQPVSTLHHGIVSAEQVVSNARSLPPKIDLSKFHTFGFLWTPEVMTFYIDQAEVLTTPNPGVCDPHYIVLSLDVLTAAGDPALGRYPAAFMVDYVRAWALA